MIAQYDNMVMSSFYLWFDHTILDKGQAFTNYQSYFYDVDSLYQGYYTYGSPFRQFVSDQSIANKHGAQIINQVYINGNPANRGGGSNFQYVNYEKGQVYFSTALSNASTRLSGNYAIKDFNIFITNDLEEKLLFETQFKPRNTTSTIATGLPSESMTYPAIFLKYDAGQNEAWQMGGGEETQFDVRAIVLSDSQFKLDAVCSIFRDRVRTLVPLIQPSNMPFNTLGDFENNVQYNYTGLVKNIPHNSGIFIDNVYISKVGGLSFTQKANLNPDVFSAMIDFELVDYRAPRSNAVI